MHENPNLWVSLWVCEIAPWLFLHWGSKRGRELSPRSQSSLCLWRFSVSAVYVVSTVFTVEFGSDLQCVQGFSTPPWLPLHINYIWLQLHHLFLQFTHLCLDNHKWVLVFLKHILILLSPSHTHTLSCTWPQLAAVCSISLHTVRSFSDARKNKICKRNEFIFQKLITELFKCNFHLGLKQ